MFNRLESYWTVGDLRVKDNKSQRFNGIEWVDLINKPKTTIFRKLISIVKRKEKVKTCIGVSKCTAKRNDDLLRYCKELEKQLIRKNLNDEPVLKPTIPEKKEEYMKKFRRDISIESRLRETIKKLQEANGELSRQYKILKNNIAEAEEEIIFDKSEAPDFFDVMPYTMNKLDSESIPTITRLRFNPAKNQLETNKSGKWEAVDPEKCGDKVVIRTVPDIKIKDYIEPMVNLSSNDTIALRSVPKDYKLKSNGQWEITTDDSKGHM